MQKLLIIGAGGFIGAVFRYLVSGYVQRLSRSIDFPYGTLSVNLIGCFLIGVMSRMDEIRSIFSPEIRFLVFTGMLGAFTTFSTFGNETVNLINDKNYFYAILNVFASVASGLLFVLAGRLVVNMLWR